VLLKELGDDLRSECEGHSAVVFSPTNHVFVRIRPEQVAQQPLIRYVSRTHDPADLFHRLQIRTQTFHKSHTAAEKRIKLKYLQRRFMMRYHRNGTRNSTGFQSLSELISKLLHLRTSHLLLVSPLLSLRY